MLRPSKDYWDRYDKEIDLYLARREAKSAESSRQQQEPDPQTGDKPLSEVEVAQELLDRTLTEGDRPRDLKNYPKNQNV